MPRYHRSPQVSNYHRRAVEAEPEATTALMMELAGQDLPTPRAFVVMNAAFGCNAGSTRYVIALTPQSCGWEEFDMRDRATNLGIGSIVAIAIAVGASIYTSARAQNPPPAGPRGIEGTALQQRPGGDLQRGNGLVFDSGPAVIANDPGVLFIVKGNSVYKVNKENMRVEGQAYLPMQPGVGGFRQTAQPGRAGNPPPPKN